MSELQSQWLAMVIKGRCRLPPAEEMTENMAQEKVICKMVKTRNFWCAGTKT